MEQLETGPNDHNWPMFKSHGACKWANQPRRWANLPNLPAAEVGEKWEKEPQQVPWLQGWEMKSRGTTQQTRNGVCMGRNDGQMAMMTATRPVGPNNGSTTGQKWAKLAP